MATYKKDPNKPRNKSNKAYRAYRPDRDYENKRNILGQQKSRTSTHDWEVGDAEKNSMAKFNFVTTTTKTKSISPNRTAVVGPGRTVSSKSRGSDHKYYTQKTKVKTIKNKNLDKFLEKNPGYKVTDGNLKTKTKTVRTSGAQKVIPPSSSSEYKEATPEQKMFTPAENQTEYHYNNVTSGGRSNVDIYRNRLGKVSSAKTTRDKTTEKGTVAKARVNKLKALIGIKNNKVKK
jgi:hypothetical protein